MKARKETRIHHHYINDQMPFVGGGLLKKCRDIRKAGQAKYVWTRLGKIFMKRGEKTRTMEIQSIEDIETFKNG